MARRSGRRDSDEKRRAAALIPDDSSEVQTVAALPRRRPADDATRTRADSGEGSAATDQATAGGAASSPEPGPAPGPPPGHQPGEATRRDRSPPQPALQLPATTTIGALCRLRLAGDDVAAFARAVPGVAVLVRLDERGGPDEPAAWAFAGRRFGRRSVLSADLSRKDSGVGVFASGADAFADEDTATGPAQFPLPVPPAREQATVHVVPATGGDVGRHQGCAVIVNERSVSRRHAQIVLGAERHTIRDHSSGNGVAINGMVLAAGQEQRLQSGDVVELGDVAFVFLDVRALFHHVLVLGGMA